MSTDDFRIVDGVLKKYTGSETEVEIPDGVQSIGEKAFWFCKSLQEVVIPTSVQSIGDSAFSWCSSLTSITIPNSVFSIGESAFLGCGSLTSIKIPDSVQSIRQNAFTGCKSLKSITIPYGVQSIKDSAFSSCESLRSITISNSVTSIGDRVFWGCTTLTSITIPDSVISIGKYAFSKCRSLKSITIPDSLQSIGSEAFNGCNSLKDINGDANTMYKDGLVIIKGKLVNYNGSNAVVIIPDNVQSIGDGAFSGCYSLTGVTIPDSVQSIGDRAFESCKSLTSITIPEGVQSIGNGAFNGCNSLRDINGDANTMYKDGLIIIKGKLEYYNGSNTVVTIPDNVQSIGDGVFSSRYSLKSVTIPDSVHSIGDSAFERCESLTSITIPDSVQSIGHDAFKGCKLLRTIELKSLVGEIGGRFGGCKNAVPKDDTTAIYLYLGGITGSLGALSQKIIQKDLDKYIIMMLDLSEPDRDYLYYKRIVSLITKGKTAISDDTIQKIEETINEWNPEDINSQKEKKKIISEISKFKDRAKIEKSIGMEKQERSDIKEVETYVDGLVHQLRNPIDIEINLPSKPVVYYKNSIVPVRDDVLKTIFGIYKTQFYKMSKVKSGVYNSHSELPKEIPLNISSEAAHIYQYIDPDSFDDLLYTLIRGKEYRYYVLSFARFASEENIETAIGEIKKRKKGTAKDKYWAENMENALVYSDTVAAMKYYETIRRLDYYASQRKTTAQLIKDSIFVPDFGFDENGVKKFQCGGLEIDVTVNPDLTLDIYNRTAGKKIKSIPSKANGVDSEQLKKMKEDFTIFKKEVKKFAEEKLQNIKQIHVGRNQINKDTWLKIYIQNPIVSVLSRGIVWSDNKNYFIPTVEGIVDVNGNNYEPDEKIWVAHILNMQSREIENWRTFLIECNIKQPFEQIWEPIFNVKQDRFDTLKGVKITQTERNAMKKDLKQKGIDVYSDKLESYFNSRTGTYLFDDENTMHFDKYLDLDYSIADDKSITFKNFHKTKSTNQYAMNAILFELLRISVNYFIKVNHPEELTKDILDSFTLAQILSFISFANNCKSTECSLALLNYKNEKYPEYDALDELTFDL